MIWWVAANGCCLCSSREMYRAEALHPVFCLFLCTSATLVAMISRLDAATLQYTKIEGIYDTVTKKQNALKPANYRMCGQGHSKTKVHDQHDIFFIFGPPGEGCTS